MVVQPKTDIRFTVVHRCNAVAEGELLRVKNKVAKEIGSRSAFLNNAPLYGAVFKPVDDVASITAHFLVHLTRITCFFRSLARLGKEDAPILFAVVDFVGKEHKVLSFAFDIVLEGSPNLGGVNLSGANSLFGVEGDQTAV